MWYESIHSIVIYFMQMNSELCVCNQGAECPPELLRGSHLQLWRSPAYCNIFFTSQGKSRLLLRTSRQGSWSGLTEPLPMSSWHWMFPNSNYILCVLKPMQLLELFQEETYKSCPNDLAICTLSRSGMKNHKHFESIISSGWPKNRKQVCS